MKMKKTIGEKLRKIAKPKGKNLIGKRGQINKHAVEKNPDRIHQCLLQIRSAIRGTKDNAKNVSVTVEGSKGNLYQGRKSKANDTKKSEMKTNNFTPKQPPRGMKNIFRSLKNLRSKSNIKGCSYKHLPKTPQQHRNTDQVAAYSPPRNELPRQMAQRRLFVRARSDLDDSLLSSRHYTLSTMMCPDTTVYSHPHPVFMEFDTDVSSPRLPSSPLTARIGSPRFASTPTSDQHASIISRIDHVLESSANQCSKIFETGHSIRLRMALEPLFHESYVTAIDIWRPWM